jgi:hypothetical protein
MNRLAHILHRGITQDLHFTRVRIDLDVDNMGAQGTPWPGGIDPGTPDEGPPVAT